MPKPVSGRYLLARLAARHHQRSEVPGCSQYNQELASQGISRGIIKARAQDPTIPGHIETFLKTRNIDDLQGSIPITWSSIVEIQHPIFTTAEEADAHFRPDDPKGVRVKASLGNINPTGNGIIDRPSIRPAGGVLERGIFLKKVNRHAPDAMVVIAGSATSENIYIPLLSYLKPDALPDEILIEIHPGELTISLPNGTVITKIPSNHPDGLAIATLNPYLPYIHNLSGYIFRTVSNIRTTQSNGILYIGRVKRNLSGYAEQQVQVAFQGNDFTIFCAAGIMIDSFQYVHTAPLHSASKKLTLVEIENYTGELVRTTTSEGGFRLGRRLLYLGSAYGKQQVLLLMHEGEIIRLWDENEVEIDLSTLHLTPVFDDQGRIFHLVPAQEHLLKRHFKDTAGWVKADLEKPEEEGRWHFAGEDKRLKKGYASIWGQQIDGIIVAIRYFFAGEATPWTAEKADDETIYKRVYKDGEISASFDQLQTQMLAWLRKNKGSVTHWRIGSGGMIMINKKHIYIDQNLEGKFLIIDFDGDTITYYAFEEPETDPAKTPLCRGRYDIEMGKKVA